MGEYIDKAKGAANELIGKIKVAVGEQTDRPELIIEGEVQEHKGHAQQLAGAIKAVLADKK